MAGIDLTQVNGISILIVIDPRELTPDKMVTIKEQAIERIKQIFTPAQCQHFKNNRLIWNVGYLKTQLGFIPQPFEIHDSTLYIRFDP